MCPAVKKQLLNLYAALGYKPTKDIIVPGYKPVPPEGGGPVPVPEDIEQQVRETTIQVLDKEGHPVEMTVQDLLASLVAEMIEVRRRNLIGYVNDEDSDGQPDGETIFLEPQDMMP